MHFCKRCDIENNRSKNETLKIRMRISLKDHFLIAKKQCAINQPPFDMSLQKGQPPHSAFVYRDAITVILMLDAS